MEEIITFIRGCGIEYRELSSTLQHLKPRGTIRWTLPPSGWVKVNVDVGFFSTAKWKASSEFIIRNEDGNIMGFRFGEHNLV